jgi:hypothetical protein
MHNRTIGIDSANGPAAKPAPHDAGEKEIASPDVGPAIP